MFEMKNKLTVDSRSQVMVGNGSAAYGASNVIVCPCLTVTDFRLTLLIRGFTKEKHFSTEIIQRNSYRNVV